MPYPKSWGVGCTKSATEPKLRADYTARVLALLHPCGRAGDGPLPDGRHRPRRARPGTRSKRHGQHRPQGRAPCVASPATPPCRMLPRHEQAAPGKGETQDLGVVSRSLAV